MSSPICWLLCTSGRLGPLIGHSSVSSNSPLLNLLCIFTNVNTQQYLWIKSSHWNHGSCLPSSGVGWNRVFFPQRSVELYIKFCRGVSSHLRVNIPLLSDTIFSSLSEVSLLGQSATLCLVSASKTRRVSVLHSKTVKCSGRPDMWV